MSAIIWKEIRENLKWAVLWMLGVAVAVACVLYQLSTPYAWPTQSLLTGNFQMITVLGAAVAAAFLGLLQTLPEMRRNQWAFLVHRPITRTRLFFGKVIAGLTLYAGAMFLPLLGAAIWTAIPGHIAAPFQWRLLLPTVADVLAGVAFYFAAMLIGIRQARWYASRALPFALPVLCSASIIGLWEFWQALLAVALSVSVLLVAAWGSFVASGQYRSQPRIAKAALGIILCIGISCVGTVIAFILAIPLEDRGSGTWTRYEVDGEGRALRVTIGDCGLSLISVTDLAGKPVDAYKGVSLDGLWQTVLLQFCGVRAELFPLCDQGGYRGSQRFFRLVKTTGRVIWYFVRSERLVVGYDCETRRCVGAIGPRGFGPTEAAVGQTFPDEELLNPSWDQERFLAFPSGVYQVDFGTRQVETLLAGNRDQPILGAGQIQTNTGRSPAEFIGVVVAARIYVFSDAAQPPISFASHYPSDKYPNIQAAVLPKGGYVIRYGPSRENLGDREQVVVVSATGTELNRYDLPPILQPDPAPTWPCALWALVTPIAGFAGFIAVTLILHRVWFGYPGAAMLWRNSQHEFFGSHAHFWILAGVVLLVGAALWAALVFSLTRRHLFSTRQSFWWALAGFFLGPAGLLTLLALREWPARVACASCGRMRVVDREQCEHCGAGFPLPEPTGTEIFDPPKGLHAPAASEESRPSAVGPTVNRGMTER